LVGGLTVAVLTLQVALCGSAVRNHKQGSHPYSNFPPLPYMLIFNM
jgi:hypothetical protein